MTGSHSVCSGPNDRNVMDRMSKVTKLGETPCDRLIRLINLPECPAEQRLLTTVRKVSVTLTQGTSDVANHRSKCSRVHRALFVVCVI